MIHTKIGDRADDPPFRPRSARIPLRAVAPTLLAGMFWSLASPSMARTDFNRDGALDVADDVARSVLEREREIDFLLPGGVPLTMVRIPPGSFTMGSPSSEVDAGWASGVEMPERRVTIAREYCLGKYEITQRQWVAVTGNNPSYFSPEDPQGRTDVTPDNPVEFVTWDDIQSFESSLNALGLGGTFRLPSEAEWEYAARAGTWTRFNFGDSDASPFLCSGCSLATHAWCCVGLFSDTAHHPVGMKSPNQFGLYDMAGNVWEWCEDYWHADYTDAPSDGTPRMSPVSSYRVYRGGGWNSKPAECRPAARAFDKPEGSNSLLGFRPAWTP